ncbi:MAG TPA: hypothetical protein VGF45_22345 [Polyangia bacterium]
MIAAVVAAMVLMSQNPESAGSCDALSQGQAPVQDLEPEPGVLAGLSTFELHEVAKKLLPSGEPPVGMMLVLEDLLYGDKRSVVFLKRTHEPSTVVLRRFSVKSDSGKMTDGPVATWTASIDAEAADLIQQVWEMMLGRVRSRPRNAVQYFHPTKYFFGSGYSSGMYLWGRAACNERPRELIEIGRALMSLAESAPESRASLRASLVALARSLRDDLVRLGHEPPNIAERRKREQHLQQPPGR